MTTPSQEAAAEARVLYFHILSEIKIRAFAILDALDGKTKMAPGFAYEFCTLQLRYICELLALGMLCAHGDIAETKTKELRELWHPSTIFKKLSELHPDFFPKPFVRIVGADRKHIGYKPIALPITKDELISLHGRTGNVLHRGSLSRLVPEIPDINEIAQWNDKIRDLLCYHTLTLSEPDFRLFCIMSDESNKVGLYLTTFEKGEPHPEYGNLYFFEPQAGERG